VRRLHARYGTARRCPVPDRGLVLAGSFGFERSISAPGITAITILWDGVEIYRRKADET
jgi:hypothetical protein